MSIALVLQTTAVWSSGATIVFSVTAPTNGSALAIMFGNSTTTPTISSITQTGATWVRAQNSTTNRGADIWYALNVSGAGTSITVNLSGTPAGACSLDYAELSGVATTGALDAVSPASGSSTTPTSATITPTAGREAVILAVMRPPGAVSAGPTNGFTGFSPPDTRTRAAYLLVPSTSGSYSTGWTASSGTWDVSIATLLAPVASVRIRSYFFTG